MTVISSNAKSPLAFLVHVYASIYIKVYTLTNWLSCWFGITINSYDRKLSFDGNSILIVIKLIFSDASLLQSVSMNPQKLWCEIFMYTED